MDENLSKSLRGGYRERKLANVPLYVLEAELWELSQLTKLNKDTRNRKARLEKVIAVKQFAQRKIQEKMQAQLEKEKNG